MGSSQVTNGFIFKLRDIDRGEITGAHQASELNSVTAVGFDAAPTSTSTTQLDVLRTALAEFGLVKGHNTDGMDSTVSGNSPACHARAAVLHCLLPHRAPTLAAQLHRHQQGISADARGRVHRGPGAARVASRPRDGAAHGTDLSRVSQPCDAEPVAPLRALADAARQVRRDCRRGLLIQPSVWPGHERCHGIRAAPPELPGRVRHR
jgi:hypothetical protein